MLYRKKKYIISLIHKILRVSINDICVVRSQKSHDSFIFAEFATIDYYSHSSLHCRDRFNPADQSAENQKSSALAKATLNINRIVVNFDGLF